MSLSMVQRTVLVVEDSDVEAEVVERGMRETKIRAKVVHVASTTDAERYLFAQFDLSTPELRPDLVVLDVRVPPTGGKELLEKLRNHPPTRSIPVLMMSSHLDDDGVKDLYRLGVNSYIDKPVDFAEFVTLISSAARYWLKLNITASRRS